MLQIKYVQKVRASRIDNSDSCFFSTSAAPSIPIISGSHSVLRDKTTTLTCNSVSRSRPNYYKKFTTIAYTWLVNELEVTHDTKSLELTIHTHTKVQCQAKEDLISTSEPFYIEALCKWKLYFFFFVCMTNIYLFYRSQFTYVLAKEKSRGMDI